MTSATRDTIAAPHPSPQLRSGADFSVVRDLFSLAALVATFAAVIGLFAISPLALEAHGIAYISSGGGVLAKFHPSTLIALGALVLRCLASRAPMRTAWRLFSSDTGIVLLIAAVVIAGGFAVFIDKTPVTPLVDTFVLPLIVFLLLRDLDPGLTRWLAICVAVILAINAVVGIVEFLDGWRLIHVDVPETVTSDPTLANATFSWQAELAEDWRSTALLGHPLVNGLIAGAFILCLLAPAAAWLPTSLRLALIALQAASLFAFGARAALVLSFLFGAWLVGVQLVAAVARGTRVNPRQIAIALLGIGVVIVGVTLLSESGFLDKTIERFTHDAGSATTRLTMFSLLDPFSWADLLLKPDKDVVATWQRMYGLEFGIESSWLGLVLIYGIIVTTLLIAGLLAFARSIVGCGARGTGVVLALYFLLVSVSATMSGKTTTFAMTVALVMLFLRRDLPGLTRRQVGLV